MSNTPEDLETELRSLTGEQLAEVTDVKPWTLPEEKWGGATQLEAGKTSDSQAPPVMISDRRLVRSEYELLSLTAKPAWPGKTPVGPSYRTPAALS